MRAEDPGSGSPPASLADGTGEHTLKIEAARAGVTVQEYCAQLGQGLLYCWHCRDWHQAAAFPADARRHTGRAGSCTRAIRAAAERLTGCGRLAPPAAVWVIKRPEPPPAPGAEPTWSYWRGPGPAPGWGRRRPGTWSPDLDQDTARFPDASQARDVLIAAHGTASAVPPGCRLARLA